MHSHASRLFSVSHSSSSTKVWFRLPLASTFRFPGTAHSHLADVLVVGVPAADAATAADGGGCCCSILFKLLHWIVDIYCKVRVRV